MWQALIGPIAGLFTKALDVVDKFIPDKDLAAKLKTALQEQILAITHNEVLALLQAQSQIIIAEAQGESWLQRNWRPMLMSTFGSIILNNYMVAPYIGALLGAEYSIMLEIPPDMWDLLKLGLSGYVVGRSMEKIADGSGLKGLVANLKNGKGA
jgi:hypothetical protein